MINFTTLYTSAKPLQGAMYGVLERSVHVAHIPGYGLHMSGHLYDTDVESLADDLKGILFGLSGMVKGLPGAEVVSLSVHSEASSGEHHIILVQMRPGQPESLKVYLNGQPR